MTSVSHELWMNSVLGRELEEGEARELFLISKREAYNKDDLLFRQGDKSRSLYLIVDGEIDIEKDTNNGKVTINEKELLAGGNAVTLDVDTDAVGFVLGAKGATLRQFETQYRTFMFFDNDCIPGTKQKRLYILGSDENRKKALAECENAVEYKMSGKSGGGQVSSWRDRGGPRYDDSYRRSRSRSRDRGRGGGGRSYDDRRYDDRRRRFAPAPCAARTR